MRKPILTAMIVMAMVLSLFATSGQAQAGEAKDFWEFYSAIHNHPFLVCTRAHESDMAGGYTAISSTGKYRGAYQFSQETWDSTAEHAGWWFLVGVHPATVNPFWQDLTAAVLYGWQGSAPWLGRCA